MKVLRIKAHNVKRIKDVDLDLRGRHLFIIGGRNRQGKSSAIDSFCYCIGGAKEIPGVPLKEGEKEGKVVVHLEGDAELQQTGLVVERTFTGRGKGELVLKSDDGFEAPTPQSLLDSLLEPGRIGFDPLAFARMRPREQLEQLQSLVGLDFTDLERERERVFTERTIVNREVKSLQARVKAAPKHEDAPEQEVVIAELLSDLRNREATNRDNAERRRGLGSRRESLKRTDEEVADRHRAIARLKEEMAEQERWLRVAEEHKAQRKKELEEEEGKIAGLRDADTEEVKREIEQADEQNRKLRENQERQQLVEEWKAKDAESQGLTNRIAEIDSERSDRMSEAQWPVDGLGFASDGITYKGRPFEQASSSEQMRISLAMGMKLNPKLKLLIIRDGALLDNQSLKEVDRLLKENDYQCLMEMSTRDEEEDKLCSVVIQEGEVVGAEG